MESAVFQSLAEAVREVPREISGIGRSIVLVLDHIGSYVLGYSSDGQATVQRHASTIASNDVNGQALIRTDVPTLVALSDGSLSPMRAFTMGKLKFTAATSPPDAPRLDRREVMGPWIAALRRAGNSMSKKVQAGADVESLQLSARVLKSGPSKANLFTIQVSSVAAKAWAVSRSFAEFGVLERTIARSAATKVRLIITLFSRSYLHVRAQCLTRALFSGI